MVKVRYLEHDISTLSFSDGKMALVSGPRQCGKTTMAKHLLAERRQGQYYNWDEIKFRRLWTKDPTQLVQGFPADNIKKPLVILDEIHKAKLWKRNLKGVYDTLNGCCDILVTGSARLNIYRKGSDSLQGRYYHFRLHPFSLAEFLMKARKSFPNELINNLFKIKPTYYKEAEKWLLKLYQWGPFPEPLLGNNQIKWNLWHRGRVEKIVREELRDLSRLPELSQVEMLLALLPERAAQVLSIQSLSEDLEAAYTTVKRWLNYLYELYYIFKIQPYSKSLPRALKKESKFYLWDWSEIEDEGARFENLIASHLLKYCDYFTDTGRGMFQLYYLRNKQKKEIDFLIVRDKKPWLPIEVKLTEQSSSENWSAFMKHLPCQHAIQIVKTEQVRDIRKTSFGQLLVISASQFLSHLV